MEMKAKSVISNLVFHGYGVMKKEELISILRISERQLVEYNLACLKGIMVKGFQPFSMHQIFLCQE